ncbi:MAG: mevalonate kinase [Myxococcota bacterium]
MGTRSGGDESGGTRRMISAGRPNDRRWPPVKAPGKLILAGEYGVLIGGSALVMAVDRHLYLQAEGTAACPADPLVNALLEQAEAITGTPLPAPHLDDSCFRTSEGLKLGLGSSAAKAAAMIGAAHVLAGDDLEAAEVREIVLQEAVAAHRRAGGGSGADVAASVLGGVVHYRLQPGAPERLLMPGDEPLALEARRVSLPKERLPVVLHGRRPLSTRDALGRLRSALAERRGPTMQLLRTVSETGSALSGALAEDGSSEREIQSAVVQSRQALEALCDYLGLAEAGGGGVLQAADEAARLFGGAAKPSGAGGGDIVLVFLPEGDLKARLALASRLDRASIDVLHVGLDDQGTTVSGPWAQNRGSCRCPAKPSRKQR